MVKDERLAQIERELEMVKNKKQSQNDCARDSY